MSGSYIDESLKRVAVGCRITLTGPEAKHAVAVSRVRIGETIAVSNGTGIMVRGTVESRTDRDVAIRVVTVDYREPDQPPIILVQALAKGDRDELAVQAATELGVAGVVPWQAHRSVVRWQGEKSARGRARWASIVREASKQSIRAHVPWVHSLVSTSQLVARAHEWDLIVLDPQGSERLMDISFAAEASSMGETGTSVVTHITSDEVDTPFAANIPSLDMPPFAEMKGIALVVGPEGGIDDDECARLVKAGARRVRLGSEVLRTSTAGPAALAVLNAKLGRW